ncbi:MAG TPA: nucleoside deaminase [Arachidicoccus sp.]|nr:nucleoside deaminase [Arachidicoccus sp.]
MEYTDEHFMRQALREAWKAFDLGEVPIGAVLVIQDQIIARTHNQVELLQDPTAHAEVLAITAACDYLSAKYLPDATLYITLEPCLMCCGALYWSKIGKIVYGAADSKNGYQSQVSRAPFHPKTKLVSGILDQECADLMQSFFKSRR